MSTLGVVTALGTRIGESYDRHEAAHAIGQLVFTGQPADTEIVTIGGRIYELDTDATADSSGDVLIDITGDSNLADNITGIVAGINDDASATVTAVDDSANSTIWLYAKTAGAAGNAITLTTDFSNCTASAATLVDGRVGGVGRKQAIRHTITSAEASAGKVRVIDPTMGHLFTANIRIEDAGVINDTPDSTIAITQPNLLVITEGTTPAWTAGDVLVIELIGLEAVA
ncbi:MAG: hypothetical protein KDA63_09335 [Planctomycetales bacterium]|nr:hypothetical protein [Planctomycetales bacterium]